MLELNEPRSFVLKKTYQAWIWIASCRKKRQVVAYAVGDRSEQTCRCLWEAIPPVSGPFTAPQICSCDPLPIFKPWLPWTSFPPELLPPKPPSMPDLCTRAVPTSVALRPFRSTSMVIPFSRVMPMVFRCVPRGYGYIQPLSLPTPTTIASSAIATPCSFLNKASKGAITSGRQEERMRQEHQ